MRLADQAGRIRGVLHDTVRVDSVERRVAEGERLAVGHLERGVRDTVQLDVAPRQVDRLLGQVDAGDPRAAPREANQVGADAAADLQQALAAIAVEVDQARQVPQLVEAVIIQIVEERERSGRCVAHLLIVDPAVPVRANLVDQRRSAGVGGGGHEEDSIRACDGTWPR